MIQQLPMFNSTAYANESEWLAARKLGLGASDSPAIFGVGYEGQSALTVWQSKTEAVRPEPSDALKRLFKRGHLMEPVIAAEFEAETGLVTQDPGDFTIFKNDELPFMFATLDRVVVHDEFGPCPVELKNVHGRNWREWEGSPPLKHVVQVQHQLAVTGASHGFLAGFLGGSELKAQLIERDERFIAVMVKKLQAFWGLVKRNEMPAVDDSTATARALAEIYPSNNGTSVVLPAEAMGWDERLTSLKRRLKILQDGKRKLESQIKAEIGDADEGTLPGGGRFTWKLQTKKEHMVKESSFRVLRRGK